MPLVKVVSDDEQLRDAYSVRSKVFIQEQNVPEEEEIDQYEKDSIHFVVYDCNQAIGAARLRLIDDYAKVERVCILKEYRGTGIGKRLMEAIEKAAADQHAQHIKLHSQTHAEIFYNKLGYETKSDIFMDAGIPHVAMEKKVRPI
ncbi:GNAT family N-acetyltransferase [Pseudalkalibacillus sp. SCS-8]|uniref:GNAT family N-acetyltransferase n=1 Tax=Pseudalkalibacillus nanhaiensis TaxID=3115291 RepID=UPI0032DAE6D5